MNEVVFRECLERTTMVLSVSRLSEPDHFVAAPRLVIVALAFSAIHVTNIVGVLFFELLRVDIVLFGELVLEVCQRFVQREPHAFEEKAQLQSAIVL